MIRAERELDACIDTALRATREVEARIDEREQRDGNQETEQWQPASDEDVERFRVLVLECARTPEWQPVLDRIDEGELTWRQVYEAPFTGRADREITAAFESLSAVPPPSEGKLVELGVLVAEPEPSAEQEAAESSAGRRRRRIIEWPS